MGVEKSKSSVRYVGRTRRRRLATVVGGLALAMMAILLPASPATAQATSASGCPEGDVCLYDGGSFDGPVHQIDANDPANHTVSASNPNYLYHQQSDVGFGVSSVVNWSSHAVILQNAVSIPAWSQKTLAGTSHDNNNHFLMIHPGTVPNPGGGSNPPACAGVLETFETGAGIWSGGDATRWSSSSLASSGSWSMRVQGRFQSSISSTLDLSGGATLTAQARAVNIEQSDRLQFEYSTNGSTWASLDSWTVGSGLANNQYTSISVTVPALTTASQIRFAVVMSNSNEYVYLDDVCLDINASTGGNNNGGGDTGGNNNGGGSNNSGGSNPPGCAGVLETFETGAGIWSGGDATRWSSSGSAANGSWFLGLQGKTRSVSTSTMDLSGGATLTAQLRAVSMEPTDKAYVEYSTNSGASWTRLATWTTGDVLSNIEYREISVAVPPATMSSQIRFVIATSLTSEYLFIDDICLDVNASTGGGNGPSGMCATPFEDFEGGYGIWTSGSGLRTGLPQFASSGTWSVKLSHHANRSTAVLLAGEPLIVSASTIGSSMEGTDNLVLEAALNGASSWTEVGRWTTETGLANGAVRTITTTVPSTTTVQLRFRLIGSHSSDTVYLDDVSITCGEPTENPSEPTNPRAGLPPAAVALGDSFIAGTGAGNYQPVAGVINGEWTPPMGFPGHVDETSYVIAADSNNPDPTVSIRPTDSQRYWCFRSASASIEVAPLPDIDHRFNLACDGAHAEEITGTYTRRDGLGSQVDQLVKVAQDHDVRVILLGIGSNGNSFSFGSVLSDCIFRYYADMNLPVDLGPCSSPSTTGFNQRTATVIQAAQTVINRLGALTNDAGDQLYPPGSYRLVMQDYTNPFSADVVTPEKQSHGMLNELLWDGAFRAGCPLHNGSIDAGHMMSERLGQMVQTAATAIRSSNPSQDVVYLNVQNAFDGAQLCEPVGDAVLDATAALAVPLRGISISNPSDPDGYEREDRPSVIRSVFWSALTAQFSSLSTAEMIASRTMHLLGCPGHRICNEAGHPNAAGHAVLGVCLSEAYQANGNTYVCARDGSQIPSPTAEWISIDAWQIERTTNGGKVSFAVNAQTNQGSISALDVAAYPSAGTVTNLVINEFEGTFDVVGLSPDQTISIDLLATARSGSAMLRDLVTVQVTSETVIPEFHQCVDSVTTFAAGVEIWGAGNAFPVGAGVWNVDGYSQAVRGTTPHLESQVLNHAGLDVTVSTNVYPHLMDAGDVLAFEVSTNGGASWTEHHRWTIGDSLADGQHQNLSVSVPGSATGAYRFVLMAGSVDYAIFDDVTISCGAGTGGGTEGGGSPPSTPSCGTSNVDFESGLGIWGRGNSQIHVDAAVAANGTRSMRLFGTTKWLQSEPQDLTGSSVDVVFAVYPESMEWHDAIVLERSANGVGGWVEVDRWSMGPDLGLGLDHVFATIDAADVTSTTALRIRLDVNSSSDTMYVDDIYIQCNSGTGTS